jgi:hypothetical protein
MGPHGLRDPGARRRLVVGLGQARPAADHLAQGPERDPVAVGRAPSRVPPDPLEQAVEILEELPGKARLADAGRSDDAHEPGPTLPVRRLEQALELAELLGPAHERSFQRLRAVAAAALGNDAQRPPGGNRGSLALEGLIAGRLEGDRAARRPLGRLADQHRARRRDALQPGRGVHEVPGDHALVRRADRHGDLAGKNPGARLDRGAQRPD